MERSATLSLASQAWATDPEREDLEFLIDTVRDRYGYDLGGYETGALRKLLKRAVVDSGCHNLVEFGNALAKDVGAISKLLQRLFQPARTPSHLLRNFQTGFNRHALPTLRTYPKFRIWHFGCANVRVTAALSEELGAAGIDQRGHVYATDLGEDVVNCARESMRTQALASHVSYFTHNFLSDSSFNAFHLVLVTNKLTNLNAETKEKILSLLHQSTIPLGFVWFAHDDLMNKSQLRQSYSGLTSKSGWYQRKV